MILGRELSKTEQKLHEVEKVLTVLHWAVRKAARYTAYHDNVVLMLHSPELNLLVHDAMTHARVRAKVLDLSAYNVTYAVSSSWDFGG